MLLNEYKQHTNRNNRELLRLLKEYHLQYELLDELNIQDNIDSMIVYFEEKMLDTNPYKTMLYDMFSISFYNIKDHNRTVRFIEFLRTLEQKYSYDGKTNFNTK